MNGAMTRHGAPTNTPAIDRMTAEERAVVVQWLASAALARALTTLNKRGDHAAPQTLAADTAAGADARNA